MKKNTVEYTSQIKGVMHAVLGTMCIWTSLFAWRWKFYWSLGMKVSGTVKFIISTGEESNAEEAATLVSERKPLI